MYFEGEGQAYDSEQLILIIEAYFQLWWLWSVISDHIKSW